MSNRPWRGRPLDTSLSGRDGIGITPTEAGIHEPNIVIGPIHGSTIGYELFFLFMRVKLDTIARRTLVPGGIIRFTILLTR